MEEIDSVHRTTLHNWVAEAKVVDLAVLQDKAVLGKAATVLAAKTIQTTNTPRLSTSHIPKTLHMAKSIKTDKTYSLITSSAIEIVTTMTMEAATVAQIAVRVTIESTITDSHNQQTKISQTMILTDLSKTKTITATNRWATIPASKT